MFFFFLFLREPLFLMSVFRWALKLMFGSKSLFARPMEPAYVRWEKREEVA